MPLSSGSYVLHNSTNSNENGCTWRGWNLVRLQDQKEHPRAQTCRYDCKPIGKLGRLKFIVYERWIDALLIYVLYNIRLNANNEYVYGVGGTCMCWNGHALQQILKLNVWLNVNHFTRPFFNSNHMLSPSLCPRPTVANFVCEPIRIGIRCASHSTLLIRITSY